MTRAERKAAREEKQAAREERQRGREKRSKEKHARIAARNARTKAENAPPPISFTPNTDPLTITDRYGNDTNHALRDLWRPNPSFLVGGGPSTLDQDMTRLGERGVVSLGVNNVVAKIQCDAFVCSDPVDKFSSDIWFDPKILKFCPKPKLKKRVRAKVAENRFQHTAYRAADCPRVFGFARNTIFHPETFLTSEIMSWGHGKNGIQEYERLNLKPRDRILFTFFLGLRLMHYLGCRRVYLLGVDFHMGSGKGEGYSFEQDRWAGAVSGNNAHYRIASNMLKELKPYFDDAGFSIYNCNKHSHLEVFDYVDYDQAIRDAKGGVCDGEPDTKGFYEKTPTGELPDKDKSDAEKRTE